MLWCQHVVLLGSGGTLKKLDLVRSKVTWDIPLKGKTLEPSSFFLFHSWPLWDEHFPPLCAVVNNKLSLHQPRGKGIWPLAEISKRVSPNKPVLFLINFLLFFFEFLCISYKTL